MKSLPKFSIVVGRKPASAVQLAGLSVTKDGDFVLSLFSDALLGDALLIKKVGLDFIQRIPQIVRTAQALARS